MRIAEPRPCTSARTGERFDAERKAGAHQPSGPDQPDLEREGGPRPASAGHHEARKVDRSIRLSRLR